MLPISSTGFGYDLFAPYALQATTTTVDVSSEYIELPELSNLNYDNLISAPEFSQITAQFLKDIEQLKTLARFYIGEQYSQDIDKFKSLMSRFPRMEFNNLLSIYRETRFHIYKIVSWLSLHQKSLTDPISSSQTQQNIITMNKDNVALLLHECLTGIDLCLPGIHSRFATVYLSLEAVQTGLSGIVFKIRHELFKQCIHAFIFKLRRSNHVSIPIIMEIHWFNGLYNLDNQRLGLKTIDDIFAPREFTQEIKQQFLLASSFSINPCTILRKLAEKWSQELLSSLELIDCAQWMKNSFPISDIPEGSMLTLERQFFNPINCHLSLENEEAKLSFEMISDIDDDYENCELSRHYEKLLAWGTKMLLGVPATVSFSLSHNTEHQYICSFSSIFFWVFNSEKSLNPGDECQFESDNYISLQLHHLNGINLRELSELSCFALLSQAMKQTTDITQKITFYLERSTEQDLVLIPELIQDHLLTLLIESIVVCSQDDTMFIVLMICDFIISKCHKVNQQQNFKNLKWLINTPLLEPVLLELMKNNIDIIHLTKMLTVWHLVNIHDENISKILTPIQCNQLFIQAFNLKQTKVMEMLLLTGHCDSQINQQNEKRQTPLMLLSETGHLEGVCYLTNRIDITNINKQDFRGFTALYFAADNNRFQCILHLLMIPGIAVNEVTINRWTALHAAASKGFDDSVRALLKSPNIKINKTNSHGHSPLHLAAMNNQCQSIEILLTSKNIKVNQRNINGLTPLHICAKKGNLESLNVLLNARNIKVNKGNYKGCTALHYAIDNGRKECVQLLLNQDDISVNCQDNDGDTPLHMATYKNDHECITELIQHPDIAANIQNNLGLNPLHIAADSGYDTCIRVLLSCQSIQVNDSTHRGYTALHLVCRATSLTKIECMKLLLSYQHIKVNKKDNNRDTALIIAIKFEQIELAKLLLENSHTDINVINKALDTALSKARRKGLVELVSLLENDPRLNRRLDHFLASFRR